MENVEETLERIKSHNGVRRVLIVDSSDRVIKHMGFEDRVEKSHLKKQENSEMEAQLNKFASQYYAIIAPLVNQSRSVVRELEPQNDLQFLRIRTKTEEILIAPDKDFTLIVAQSPGEE